MANIGCVSGAVLSTFTAIATSFGSWFNKDVPVIGLTGEISFLAFAVPASPVFLILKRVGSPCFIFFKSINSWSCNIGDSGILFVLEGVTPSFVVAN